MGINNTQRGGAGAGRGDDPHGVTHGEEGLTRTDFHPLMGNSSYDSVGTYLGSTGAPGNPRSHFFSAESTKGGQTDSHVVHDTDQFKWHGDLGKKYAFNRKNAHSGNISPYNGSVHYGIPGAPMSDTPAKYHDRNYR